MTIEIPRLGIAEDCGLPATAPDASTTHGKEKTQTFALIYAFAKNLSLRDNLRGCHSRPFPTIFVRTGISLLSQQMFVFAFNWIKIS